MSNRPQKALCYHIKREKSHGYFHVYIRAFFLEKKSLSKLVAGTVDNKAGYGSPEAAERMGEWYRMLMSEGHKNVFTSGYGDEMSSVTMSWMETPGYGSSGPGFTGGKIEEFGNGQYQAALHAMKLIRRIGNRIEKLAFDRSGGPRWDDDKQVETSNRTFASPTLFINALNSMKAKRVRYQSGSGAGDWVHDKDARQWLLSDTLLMSFEVW